MTSAVRGAFDDRYEAAVKKVAPRLSTWADIIGNVRAVEILQEAIRVADMEGRPMPHALLFSPPGSGKTTISRLVARSVGGEYIETTASTLETPQDCVRLIDRLNLGFEKTGRPSLCFIDEIHVLGQSKGRQSIDQESFYSILDSWIFHHNLAGKSITYDDGSTWQLRGSSMHVYPCTVLGATTEPGMLSQPLLRRFVLQIELEPYTEVETTKIVLGFGAQMGWSISTEAAAVLSRYARRNPGQAYRLITMAWNRAVASGQQEISPKIAQDVISRLGLYRLGLTGSDIRALQLLTERPKGMGQAELSRALNVSVSTWNAIQEPYLRFLGLVETLSRRMITSTGRAYLEQEGLLP